MEEFETQEPKLWQAWVMLFNGEPDNDKEIVGLLATHEEKLELEQKNDRTTERSNRE